MTPALEKDLLPAVWSCCSTPARRLLRLFFILSVRKAARDVRHPDKSRVIPLAKEEYGVAALPGSAFGKDNSGLQDGRLSTPNSHELYVLPRQECVIHGWLCAIGDSAKCISIGSVADAALCHRSDESCSGKDQMCTYIAKGWHFLNAEYVYIGCRPFHMQIPHPSP